MARRRQCWAAHGETNSTARGEICRTLTNGSPHGERRRSTSGERVRSSAVNKKQRELEVCEPEHRGGGEAVPFREAQVGGVGSSPLPIEIRVDVGGATTLQNCVTLQAVNIAMFS